MIHKLFIISLLMLCVVPILAQDDTEESSFNPDTAIVRVGHFIPDAPDVDIYLDGELALTGLAFGEISEWSFLDAGRYLIEVYEAGAVDTVEESSDSDDEAADSVEVVAAAVPLLSGNFNFGAGSQVTITAMGTVENNSTAFGWFFDDYSRTIEEGSVGVTIYHAIDAAQGVDIYADGELLLEDVAYPSASNALSGARTIDVPAGQYDLSITVANDVETELLTADGVDFLEGSFYTVVAIGLPLEPDVIVVRTSTDG
ncbi:MAG: DUF4397 domain-containing protein [Aggregatilineales bacterium]